MSHATWVQTTSLTKCLMESESRQISVGNVLSNLITRSFRQEMSQVNWLHVFSDKKYMSHVIWSQAASQWKCLRYSDYRQLPMGNVSSDLITGSFPKRNVSINLITDSFPQEMPQVMSLQAVSCRNCLLLYLIAEGLLKVGLMWSYCRHLSAHAIWLPKHCLMQTDYCLIQSRAKVMQLKFVTLL